MLTFFKRKWSLFLILLIILLTGCKDETDKGIYNIRDFGARGKGEICTQFIQEAINTCAENGGGTVLVPPGIYVSGTIILLDNINFKVSDGAELKGSLDTGDYVVDGVRHGLIYAQNAKNISITGGGVINGNGTAFMDPSRSHIANDFDRTRTRQGESFIPAGKLFEDGPIAYEYRPGMMLVMLSCENITLRDITFIDSPSWTIRFGECDNVMVDGISIYNNLLIPNSDGIHCTVSRNVRISNCDIRAGDDAIIVTGFPNPIGVHGSNEERDTDLGMGKIGNTSGFAENVTVSNCLLQSRSAGIRVGYGEIPIRNCVFSNLVIYDSNRGIGVFARDNANISNIHFDNIIIQNRLHSGHWWGNGEPIHVSSIPQTEGIPSGKIKNIHFNNITAESESGIIVFSYENELVEGIFFENLNLTIKKGRLSDEYGGNIDLRPVWDKKWAIFKNDIPGILMHNINNISIKDFDLSWGEDLPEYHTNGIEFIQSRNIELTGFKGKQGYDSNENAAVKMICCGDFRIQDCYAKPGTNTFLFLQDHAGKKVILNNHTENAARVINIK